MVKRKTPKEYRKECENAGVDLPIKDYINATTPIEFKCNKGHIYEQLPNAHLKGKGCIICYKLSKRKTPEQYLQECKDKGIDLPIEPYITARTPIKHKCKRGHIYESLPNDHLNGHGCRLCQYETINRKSLDYFKDKILKKFSDIEILDIQRNNNEKGITATLKCLKHGCTYETNVYDLLSKGRGNHCIKCANENRVNNRDGKTAKKDSESYIQECRDRDLDSPIEDYIDSSTKIKHRCNRCGNIYPCRPYAHLSRSSGCPKCFESHGEKYIRNYLDKNNIKYIPQKKFHDLKDKDYLSYDFYLPDYNILIEYQGIQHYEPSEYFGGEEQFRVQQLHDKLKRDYAKDNGYKMLELKYTLDNQDKVDKYLKQQGLQSSLDNIQSKLESILDKYNIKYKRSDIYTLHIDKTNVYLRVRNIKEQHHVAVNQPRMYFNLHKDYLSQGNRLIFIDDYMLKEPLLSDYTIPYLEMCKEGKAEYTLYGRQVICKEAKKPKEKSRLREFVNKYHLQGQHGAKFYYGFYTKKDNTLVGVMTYGKNLNPAYKEDEKLIELKRMVWLPSVQVRFGVSKGIKTFLREHPEYDKILSYSLNDISNGNTYRKSGFDFIKLAPPSKRYVNPNDAMDSYSFQINSTWGFSTGVVAKRVHPYNKEESKSSKLREQVIENLLPHRTDDGKGYIPMVNSGNTLWMYHKK